MPRAAVPGRSLGSAWAPRPGNRRGTATLSRESIVKGAIAVIDREGVAGLTMRSLASELGAAATTFYWHVTDKEELLDLVVDEVLGEVAIPEGAMDWQDRLRSVFGELRLALSRHRDMSFLVSNRINVGPHALRLRELITETLLEAGLPSSTALMADQALFAYTLGASEAASAAFDVDDPTERTDGGIGAYLRSLPADRYPSLVHVCSNPELASEADHFRYGLDALLAGIAAGIPRGRR